MDAIVDTTSLIWDQLFMVRVPKMQVTSVDYIRTYGTYVTGDVNIDMERSNEWITTMISISKMVTYYKEGVQIKVVNYKDIAVIYDNITQHLNAWKERLKYGINVGAAPIADLLAIDQFANVIYEHAKYTFTPDVLESILAKNLTGVVRLNKQNLFTTNASKTEIGSDGIIRINNGTESKDAYPERVSMGELLTNRIYGGKRWT